jgi:ppGpp synthetase/RelA/SpoT-type nucleotidyltranferase
MATLSKTQIDRLGDRLKKGSPIEADLRLLDEYRRSFGQSYDEVVRTIRKRLLLQPTGRPAKSTTSITEKLRRESIRLSQVQDIAGCRVIVANIIAQDRAVRSLCQIFPNTITMDRRKISSHGYRAVHVMIKIAERLIEVQVRSTLQHLWAEISERLSDKVDPAIKYGGGHEQIKQVLFQTSEMVAEFEDLEKETKAGTLQKRRREEHMTRLKQKITEYLNRLIFVIEGLH